MASATAAAVVDAIAAAATAPRPASLVDEGFGPVFQPSLQDTRSGRPASRLALLGGVLPEDEPGLASALGLPARPDRSAFRPPARLEGGFVPLVPLTLAGRNAPPLAPPAPPAPTASAVSAPQIIGPIPSGYLDVLRGSPVQLDLPRPDRPTSFLAAPAPPHRPPFRQL